MSSCSSDLLHDGMQKKRHKTVGSIFAYPLIVILIILVGIFVGKTLFGTNSLEVLLALKQEDKELTKKIYLLKKENANLQKKYLEYKILMPNEELQ